MNNYFRDEKGRMIGFVQQNGNQTMYFDDKGRLAARIHDGLTFDDKGSIRGNGDQGLRLLGEKND